MKQLIFVFILSLFSMQGIAQDASPFQMEMGRALAQLNQASTNENFGNVAKQFDHIEKAYPTEWLPIYYSAYAQTMKAFVHGKGADLEKQLLPSMKKLDGLIKSIPKEENQKQLAEINTLQSMMCNALINMNQLKFGPTYGSKAKDYMNSAIALDPTNPRIYLLEAQNLFYSPEEYGGDKKGALTKCETALQLFENEIGGGESSFLPSWGMSQAQALMDLIVQSLED